MAPRPLLIWAGNAFQERVNYNFVRFPHLWNLLMLN